MTLASILSKNPSVIKIEALKNHSLFARMSTSVAMESAQLNNEHTILELGKNCCAYKRAYHLYFLVDAADYYTALRYALQKARNFVYITAWDIKSYTLIRDRSSPDCAIKLISMFKMALLANPNLHIYILCWNWTLLFLHDRELFARLKWRFNGHPRLHFKLDSTHPLGGSHHQKIVVMDDGIAFCGGMDLTDERWDTSDHTQPNYIRRNYHGKQYRPHHDVQVAVNGPVAKSLGDIFRKLWLDSTGEILDSIDNAPIICLDYLKPDIENIKVAISRTIPRRAYEVIDLFTDAIASAKDYIYIENQYFSWLGAVDLLEKKLRDPDGPEIVLVLPENYTGRLEKIAIGKLTAQIVEKLRSVDHYKRLGVFYPKIIGSGDGSSVKVHSKVMIIDGRFLRIGSANFSNRSMSVDTECDLAIEAGGNPMFQRSIEDFLFRLVSEHHGCCKKELETQVRNSNSLLTAIRHLSKDSHRHLAKLQFDKNRLKKSQILALLAIDPPASWYHIITHRKLSLRRLKNGFPAYIHPAEEICKSFLPPPKSFENSGNELH